MNKPDSANGSLDSILASIRKSLAEQSTDALQEAPPAVAPQAKSAKAEGKAEAKPRPAGLAQRLAGAEKADARVQAQGGDDLSDLLAEPLADAAGTAQPGPATQPAAVDGAIKEDPLWFLTRTEEPASGNGNTSPAASSAPEKKPAAEPVLTRPEVVRASMPPFFGSAAELAKPEPPAEPNSSTVAAAAAAKPAAPPPQSPVAVTHNSPPAASPPPATAPVADVRPAPILNGQAPATPVASAPASAAATGDAAAARGLEVAVLDLLKPMLSQWLDQNMPRLVAEALKDESVRSRAPGGDAKKT